jgi:hypothetical protein
MIVLQPGRGDRQRGAALAQIRICELLGRVRGLRRHPDLRGSARASRGPDWVCSGKVAVGGRPKAALLAGNGASLPPPGICPQVSAKQSILAGNWMLRLRGSC